MEIIIITRGERVLGEESGVRKRCVRFGKMNLKNFVTPKSVGRSYPPASAKSVHYEFTVLVLIHRAVRLPTT